MLTRNSHINEAFSFLLLASERAMHQESDDGTQIYKTQDAYDDIQSHKGVNGTNVCCMVTSFWQKQCLIL